jgi:hypothetical protein
MPSQRAPCGQAMIEMILLLAVIGLLGVAISLIGVWGTVSTKVAQSARVAAFDCDMRPGYCVNQSPTVESNLRARMLSSDRREILAGDQPPLLRYSSLHQHARLFEKSEDIRLVVDLPPVDGADKSLFLKLADAFRGLAMKAGPALFDLSSPDQLTRTTVRATLWASRGQGFKVNQLPSLEFQSRLALISDSWSADDRSMFYSRTALGENPSQFAEAVANYFYVPGKDLLMPTFDFIGLDHNTKTFRDGFHEPNHDQAYKNTRLRIR